MKKTKLTSVVCAAALALSMPAAAFAAPAADGGQAYNAQPLAVLGTDATGAVQNGTVTSPIQGQAGTVINVRTFISQISVDVPLSFSIALDAQGGNAVCPTDYKIVNKSRVPVTVTKADVQAETGNAQISIPDPTNTTNPVVGTMGQITSGAITPLTQEEADALKGAGNFNVANSYKATNALPIAITGTSAAPQWIIGAGVDSGTATRTVTGYATGKDKAIVAAKYSGALKTLIQNSTSAADVYQAIKDDGKTPDDADFSFSDASAMTGTELLLKVTAVNTKLTGAKQEGSIDAIAKVIYTIEAAGDLS